MGDVFFFGGPLGGTHTEFDIYPELPQYTNTCFSVPVVVVVFSLPLHQYNIVKASLPYTYIYEYTCMYIYICRPLYVCFPPLSIQPLPPSPPPQREQDYIIKLYAPPRDKIF